MAVGHSILVVCWHLLTDDADHDDLDGDYFVRRANPDRQRDPLVGQLGNWANHVALRQAAAGAPG